jgi:hypothetical protein
MGDEQQNLDYAVWLEFARILRGGNFRSPILSDRSLGALGTMAVEHY